MGWAATYGQSTLRDMKVRMDNGNILIYSADSLRLCRVELVAYGNCTGMFVQPLSTGEHYFEMYDCNLREELSEKLNLGIYVETCASYDPASTSVRVEIHDSLITGWDWGMHWLDSGCNISGYYGCENFSGNTTYNVMYSNYQGDYIELCP